MYSSWESITEDAVPVRYLFDRPVEAPVEHRQGVHVLDLQGAVHFPQEDIQFGDMPGLDVLHDGGQKEHHHGVADDEDLLDVADGKGVDDHAAVRRVLYQAVSLQAVERLPQRGPADMEKLRISGLHDPCTGRDLPGDDAMLELLIRRVTDRLILLDRREIHCHEKSSQPAQKEKNNTKTL